SLRYAISSSSQPVRSSSTIRIMFFFFTATATTEIYTLSLHDALPISWNLTRRCNLECAHCYIAAGPHESAATELDTAACQAPLRSEEHTSELQSRFDLVCRLLLEKKKKKPQYRTHRRSRGPDF